MKHLSAGIKIGVFTLLVTVLGYYLWKNIGEQASGEGGYGVHAKFKDATGLPKQSRVVIAGLPVGEISDRTLDGRLARINMRLRKDTELWSNASIFKKSSSLLGEYYLEIDPGTPQSVQPDGSMVANRRLKDGDEILNVYEAATADELMRRVSETMPQLNEVLSEVEGLAAETRELVKGPIREMAGTLNESVQQDAVLVRSILERADRAMADVEKIADDIGKVTHGTEGQVDRIIGNIETTTEDLKSLVAETREQVGSVGGSVREKLDRLDGALASLEGTLTHSKEIARKVDEDEGTLGRLVNDPQIGDDVAQITSSSASFVQTAFGLQTVVGIRSEYNVVGEAFKTYFSIELMPRPDKYYLVEIVDDPRGKVVQTLDYDGGFTRQTQIEEDGIRFTFQFAKKVDPFVFRIGIKESSGGVGTDLHLFDSRLTMSADVFDASFDRLPRLKFMAAYQFFKYLYIYGGVDDVLNDSVSQVLPDSFTGEPATYHYGRDYFGGAMLRFNDLDMAALLFIGGAALGAAAQ